MIFCMKTKTDVFDKLVVSLLPIAGHTRSTQNSKFVICLQYLKKKLRDEVNLLHADKRKTIL